MAIQLRLFEPDGEEKTEVGYLREEIRDVRESGDKVRKSVFAKHSELAKKYLELHQRMEILEQNICRGQASLGGLFGS